MFRDEERREVARRLREMDYEHVKESPICSYIDAFGEKYLDWVEIAHRLADLIEPACDRDRKCIALFEMDFDDEDGEL